jgi:ribosomal protein S18 acetylase RimI-like enzyme
MARHHSEIRRIAVLNSECISFDDPYSDYRHLRSLLDHGQLDYLTTRDKKRRIVGYLIYRILPTHLESIRRGVTKKARREGYGTLLSRQLIGIATQLGVPIYTYVSKSNLPSLNGNLRVGYRITDISEHWVYLEYPGP